MNQNEQQNNGGRVDLTKKAMDIIMKKFSLVSAGFGCLAFVFIAFLIFIVAYKAIGTLAPIFLSDTEESEVDDSELLEEEEAFREKIEDVANDIYSSEGVEIKKSLLVATVLYTKDDEVMMNPEGSDEILTDDDTTSDSSDKYKISKRELKKIAKNMISDGSYSEESYRQYLISSYIPENFPSAGTSEIKEIADEIFSLAKYYEELFYDGNLNETSNGCDPFASLKVNVNGNKISFKEYVIGVVWPESSYWSADSSSASIEYGKAQTMASKTYALKNLYTTGATEINVSNTTEGFQVWCDIYTPGACGSTGTPTEQQITNLKQRYDDIAGIFRVDNNGNLINTQYASDDNRCCYYEDGSPNTSHKCCKEDASSNAMSQASAYKYAQQGKSFEEILDIYYQGHNGAYGNTSAVCTTQKGTLPNWKQYDSQWATVKIGDNTLQKVGCLVTSIAMLINQSGVETGIDNFNPGTFAKKLNDNSYFTSGGSLLSYNYKDIGIDFEYVGEVEICGLSEKEKASKVKDLLDQGYYVTMEVKGARTCGNSIGQHWVAVDSVSGSKIFMSDPASDSTEVFATYGNIGNKLVYFKAS